MLSETPKQKFHAARKAKIGSDPSLIEPQYHAAAKRFYAQEKAHVMRNLELLFDRGKTYNQAIRDVMKYSLNNPRKWSLVGYARTLRIQLAK